MENTEGTGKIRAIIRNAMTEMQRPGSFTDVEAASAYRFHHSLPDYQPTKLFSLPALAKRLNVGAIYVKDESTRFGLNAFKGLGGTYAMYRILCCKLGVEPEKVDFTFFQREDIRKKIAEIIFVTATDGNHGRGVSWAAGLFGCRAFVFMPCGSSEERAEAIRAAGPAKVEITDKNYDETVAYAKEMSDRYHWVLIQDTAWDGYEQIPLWIIQGYLTMAWEVISELEKSSICPTHVFLQAGVGAMAGGICGFLLNYYADKHPVVCVVEPDAAACVFLSAQYEDGNAHSIEGDPVTIMAGLNCGTPCKITWPILRDFVTGYFACPDYVAAHGMRTYANPVGEDLPVVAGESGAVTMGIVRMLLEDGSLKDIRNQLELKPDSVILLFNTEGDTDTECYRNIVQMGAYSVPKK